jgi:signal transduction histidine kinase/CheY-like chemotaxis protein
MDVARIGQVPDFTHTNVTQPGESRLASASEPASYAACKRRRPPASRNAEYHRMKLSTRLLLLILVCLLPVVGAQLYAEYNLHAQRHRELTMLALHQAELANGDLASIADGLRHLTTAVAQFPAVRDVTNECGERLASVQRRAPAVLFFAAFDRTGRTLCSSTSLPLGRTPAWAGLLIAQPGDGVGSYSLPANGRASFVPFGVHPDQPGGRVALIVAALNLQWLEQRLAQMRLSLGSTPADSVLYVTDRDGVVVGHSPGALYTVGQVLPPKLLAAERTATGGVARISDAAGGMHLVASIPVPATGLAAVVSLSALDLMPALLRDAWRDTLLMLAATAVTLILAWLIGRRFIARPTQDLLAAAHRWRDGDLGVRAEETRGGAEFAALAQSFNAMASSLQARELERRLQAESLEAQVAERTRALSESNNRLQVEIAERAKTETVLHQSQKLHAVGQLAGGIAHDFNNMLATVMGSLELMERRVQRSTERWSSTDAERMLALITRATGAVQRGGQLTSRLLAFSRRQQLAARPTDMNQLISDLVTLASPTLGRRIRVQTELTEGLTPAMVDPSQVEAALLNCCLNARDSMAEGGVLTIGTALHHVTPNGAPDDPLPGNYVRVSIADTGTGMTTEVLGRAFEPFFTTKGPSGSGLGLSQVYGMVRQSGGAVQIASAPGAGTQVTLLLPVAEVEAAAVEQRATQPRDGASPPCLVLAVDDDLAVRQVTVEMLRDLGCEVMQAPGGADALALIETSPRMPDVVLLDYAMPGMNGVQLARALRERGLRVPIALVTGYAELADRDTDGSPLNALLRKPFTIRDLDRLLDRLRRVGDGVEAARVGG